MASIDITKFGEAVAANVTTKGVVQVVDSTKYWAGAEAWLSNATSNTRVIITNIIDSTHIQVRAIPEDTGGNVNHLSYGMGNDLSAYTTVATSRIDMPGQTVRIDPALTVRKTLVTN